MNMLIFNQKTVYICLILLFVSGCLSNKNEGDSGTKEKVPLVQEEKSTEPPKFGIPYNVISEERIDTLERKLEVQLKERLPQEQLTKLANHIKDVEPTAYENTLIGYYVSGMDTGSGVWATTNFLPDLVVQIFRLTVEEYKKLSDLGMSQKAESCLGAWLDDYSSGHITIICSEAEDYVMKNTYVDASEEKLSLKKEDTEEGTKLEKENSEGEYYLLTSKGKLEYWNESGHYYTAKTIWKK